MKTVTLLLPIILLFLAFDSGGHKDLPKIGVSVVLMLFCVALLILEKNIKIPGKYPTLFFGIFVLYALLSSFWSMSIAKTINEAIYLGGIFSAFVIGANIIKQRKMRTLMLAVAFVITGIGFYFFLMPRFGLLEKAHDMQNYFFGTFYWKNPAAAYISLFIPITLYALLKSKKTWHKVLWSLCLIVFSSAFVLTRSRGALLSMALAIFVAIFVLFIKKDLLRKTISAIKQDIVFIAVVLVISASIIGLLLPREAKRQQISVQEVKQERSSFERKAMYKLGFKVFQDKPFGTGLGAFIDAYPKYLESSFYLSKHLHNQYLQYLVETGFIGCLIFCLVFLSIFFSLIKRKNPFSIAVFISFLAFSAHLFLDFHWTFSGIAFPAFILFGMAIPVEVKTKKVWLLGVIPLILLSIAGIMSATSIIAMDNAKIYDYGKWVSISAKSFPVSAEKRYYLAQYLKSTGKTDEAKIEFRKAIKLEPESASLNAAFGHFLIENNEIEGLSYLLKSIKLAPFSSPLNYNRIGDIFLAENKTEKAQEMFSEVIAKFSSNPSENYTSKLYSHRYHVGYAHRVLGGILEEKGDFEKAITHLKTAKILQTPRLKDALARQIGIDTNAPEKIAADYVYIYSEKNITFVGIEKADYDLFAGQASIDLFYVSENDSIGTQIERANLRVVLKESGWQILR